MKEYGSSIQKLVDNMVNIEDREKRTRYAHILIELMRQIHPGMKEGQDYYNKLWDDLYIISNFTLDVDSPYPPPSEEALGRHPQPVPYNTHHLKFKHFGRNVDLLVAKAVALDDADERRAFVSYLVRLMRTFYQAWNKEAVEDETIYEGLIEISKGKLYDDVKLIREQGLVESTPRERAGEASQPQRIGGGNNRNNQGGNQNRNNNNDRRNFNNRNQGGNQNRNNNNNDRRNLGNNNNRNNQGGGGQNRNNNNDRRRR
ncbi:DUF4290 domain-containing protein [uncultured Spirosoma sp.]|uniref:DUF4290 domain-containing protein n=1 Tax=uncultured Spirosoma sp. TaxID=278208 RepID=UPI002584E7C0|nr:DUF4290 domain-containing protein [uncultured Spirosoma sp.]